MTAPAQVEVGRGIGAPVERKEDRKLLQGQAQWVDNMSVPGMVYLGVVRSPYAHARIVKVNVAPALAHAGVVAAWSGEDLVDEWHGSLPCAWIPTEETNAPEHKPLSIDKARHAGDAVAVIAATSRGAAADAAELVEVEYEPLEAIVDARVALDDAKPVLHEDSGSNSTSTSSDASRASSRVSATTATTGSPTYRTLPTASA